MATNKICTTPWMHHYEEQNRYEEQVGPVIIIKKVVKCEKCGDRTVLREPKGRRRAR